MTSPLGIANRTWDKLQFAAFFVQEALIGLLYIHATHAHLKNMTLLGADKTATLRTLRQLIAVNVFIIFLDCSLMGLCYSDLFFLQIYYKATVYAVKLRTEFTILNQLRASLLPRGTQACCPDHVCLGTELHGKQKPPVLVRPSEEEVEIKKASGGGEAC
jgi:hypothetical protein